MPLPEFKTWQEVIEFEDYDGLTDDELLVLNDMQIDALRRLQAINPAVTDEMINEVKKHANNFALAYLKEKEALKAEAIAQRNLDASIDNILSHPNLPNGKPLPITPKHKGN
jgi:hypothetical protein